MLIRCATRMVPHTAWVVATLMFLTFTCAARRLVLEGCREMGKTGIRSGLERLGLAAAPLEPHEFEKRDAHALRSGRPEHGLRAQRRHPGDLGSVCA